MSKELLYLKTRRWFYMKFDKLIVTADVDNIMLSNKYYNSNIVRIYKYDDKILVYYHAGFREHLTKTIPLKKPDFEFSLKEWIEDNFDLKIDYLYESEF